MSIIRAFAVFCLVAAAYALPAPDQWSELTHPNVPSGPSGVLIDSSPEVLAPAAPFAIQLPSGDALELVQADEASRWLAEHNKYRCMHGVPAVSWSTAMAASAQAWADKGGQSHSNSYQEAPPAGPAGENLAWGYGTLEAATAGWYSEVKDCTSLPGCTAGKNGAAVGHFTAIVWKGERQIGCGINAAKKMYVCRYKGDDTLNANTPNMQGAYTANVLPVARTEAQCSGSGGSGPAPPPAAATPAPAPPSNCKDGWSGCSGWKSLCGLGYNMQGMDSTLDAFCCATCS